VTDVSGLVAERFALSPGSFYLVRPDQHVAARWRAFDAKKVRLALARAKGLDAAALREIAE
jgi:3-(3-hydroxy-phenyl)propionate hydroxylase